MSDFSRWSDVRENGTTSAYNSAQIYSPTLSNRQRPLPDLPLSPIKTTDLMRTERSLMGALENRRLTFNKNNTVSTKTPDEQYSVFRQRLQEGFYIDGENNSLRAEDIKGKDLYDKVVKLREYVKRGRNSRKNGRNKAYSTFRSPTPSFEICKDVEIDTDQTIEAPRYNTQSEKTSPTNTSHLLAQLLDVNLKSYEDFGVGNREITCATKAVETTPGLKSRFKSLGRRPSSSCKDLSELRPSVHLHTERRSLSPLRQTNEYDNQFRNSRPSRTEVNKIVRGLFCNVDEIPHKGNLQNARQQQDSQSVRNLLRGSRPTSRSRIPLRTSAEPNKKITSKESPMKPPPFCSSVSNSDYSQAVHANEQQLIRLVNTHFPHWRVFVRNLLADSNVENDVAINFLQEIENRSISKELASKMHRDQRVEEFNQTDEKILNKLREKLCRGHASRIHQLRILQQVLRESC